MADEQAVTGEGLPTTAAGCREAVQASKRRQAELRDELKRFKAETDEALHLEETIQSAMLEREREIKASIASAASASVSAG